MDTKSDAIVIDLDEPTAGPATATSAIIDEASGTTVVIDEADDGSFVLPKRAKRNEDGSITLTLLKSVALSVRSARSGKVTDNTYAELTFGRMHGEDTIAILNASKESQPIIMLARSARLHVPVMMAIFKRMDAEDIADASTIVGSFFGNGSGRRDKA